MTYKGWKITKNQENGKYMFYNGVTEAKLKKINTPEAIKALDKLIENAKDGDVTPTIKHIKARIDQLERAGHIHLLSMRQHNAL